MKRLTPFFVLLTLLGSGCTRSFQVYDVKHLKQRDRDYLFYALPKTVVTVDVPVTRIETPYDPENLPPCRSEVAMREELGLDTPPATPEEASKVFKAGAPAIATRSEPDPEAIYAIDLRFRPFALTSGSFELTDNGVLTTETVSQEDKSIDTVLTVARLAAAVATGGAITPAAAAVAPMAASGTPKTPKRPSACEQARDAILDIRTKKTKVLSDCAFAILDPQTIGFDASDLDGGGTLRRTIIQPEEQLDVEKIGRTTGRTRGIVTAFNIDDVRVDYDDGSVFFDDQIEIESVNAQPFSLGGDSGSLIFERSFDPVALLFAGSETGGTFHSGLTYANPMETVLSRLRVELLT